MRTGSGSDTINIPAINIGFYAAEVYSGAGNDLITTGESLDFLAGEAGNDTLNGGAGDDILFGGDGNDILNGQADNDQLYGETGNDTLNGGDGDDYLNTGIGVDIVNGGTGIDRLEIDNRNDTANTTVTYTTSTNGIVSGGSNSGTTFRDVERITLRTGSGSDTINIPAINIGFYAAEVYSGAGNDLITTGSSRDFLAGEAGNDTLYQIVK